MAEEEEKEEEEKEEEEEEQDKLQNGRSWSSAKLSQTPSPHCLLPQAKRVTMLCHFFQMLFHLFHFCISVFVYLCISPSPHPQSILSLTHLQTMTSRKKFCDNRLELVMKVIKYLKKGKDIKKEVYMENKLKKRNKLIIIKTILW